jgi:hypothetical protein
VFYIYVTEGSSSSDYSLIRLTKKGNRREFLIGGLAGMMGGGKAAKLVCSRGRFLFTSNMPESGLVRSRCRGSNQMASFFDRTIARQETQR